MILGIFMGILLLGLGGLNHFFLSSSIVYIMILLLPRDKLAIPVFIFAISYLSYLHIHRMMVDWMGWRMDASCPQMILTAKLTSLAFCLEDGAVIKQKPHRIAPEQHQWIVYKTPNLLEYFSYLLFYPGALAGPRFEYADFIKFIEQRDEYAKIPCTFLPAMKKFCEGVLAALVTVFVFAPYFDHHYMTTEEYFNEPLWYRIIYFPISMELLKVRYVTAFKLTESSMISSGFNYQGTDPVSGPKFERVRSIYYYDLVLGKTFRDRVNSWNIGISDWLRFYIYNRIQYGGESKEPSITRRNNAQHAAFVTSAIWHGFYPTYYVFFILFSFLTEVSKQAYVSDLSKYPFPFLRGAIWSLLLLFIGNYIGVGFTLLDTYLSFRFWASFYYIPWIMLGLLWLFFKFVKLPRVRRTEKVD
jgi:lysophospholipid acyltransferase